MIEAILQRFGYVKGTYRNLDKEPFTEAEISKMLSDIIYIEDITVDKDSEQKVYSALKEVEGYVELLRVTSERDKNRYFTAQTPQEQLLTRGAFGRTHYWKSKVMREEGVNESKLDGVRYD